MIQTIATPALWAGFAAFVVIAIAIDLLVVERQGAHTVRTREAVVWSLIWFAMAFVFVAVEIVVEFGLALLAHRVRPWLQRAGRRFNRACGGMFMAMGLALPMTR